MTTDPDAGEGYDISGYPHIKFFGKDKYDPAVYDDERECDSLIAYALDE